MGDREEAVAFAREVCDNEDYPSSRVRRLATALLAAEAEIERLRRERDPQLVACEACGADIGVPCVYVAHRPRIWWPEEDAKRINIHRSRIDAAEPTKKAVRVRRSGHTCKGSNDAEPLHACPYKEEINDNSTDLCNCCATCQHECAMDI